MQSIILLAVYAAVMIGATVVLTKREKSLQRFLVGDRKMGAFAGGLGIAAAWVWAPSLFVSAEHAYTKGLPGLFWFVVPNVLCLLLFVPFAKRIRAAMPQGVTLSGYMAERYQDKRVKGAYLTQLGALAVCSTGVQLLAGGKMLALLTGIPYGAAVIAMAATAAIYSMRGGAPASKVSNVVQMLVLLTGCAILVPWLLYKVSGPGAILQGLGSITGEFTSLTSETGRAVFVSFGLPTTIGLLSGPFGDQTFWQKAFSIRERSIGKAFTLGAFLFAIVPLSMGAVGYIAAGTGYIANDTGVVNVELITHLLPAVATVPLILMLLSGLLSTIDNNLCSAAALVTDIVPPALRKSKIGMAALLVAGIGVAFIPGITVTRLFLFYGTLRATTLFPTVFSLLGVKLKPGWVFAGIAAGLCVGLPIFAAGDVLALPMVKLGGSLVSVLLPACVALLGKRRAVRA